MSTATLAAPTGSTFAVRISPAITSKAQYLQALSLKLKASAVNGVNNTTAFSIRLWKAIPSHISGAIVAGFIATGEGYVKVVNLLHKTVDFALGAVKWAVKRISYVFDHITAGISFLVGKLSKPVGKWLANKACDVSDLVHRGIDGLFGIAESTTGVLFGALRSPAVVDITVGTARGLGWGIFLNAITGGAVAAGFAGIPVIGAALASAATGGFATVAFLGIFALSLGAGKLLHTGYELLRPKIGRKARSFGSGISNAVRSVIKPTLRMVKDEPVTSHIAEVHGEKMIVVENAASLAEAQAVAAQHAAAELRKAEQQIRSGNKKRRR